MPAENQSRNTTVLIIESHVLMRQILANMMRNCDDVVLTGAFGFSDEAVALSTIDTLNPDLILLGVDKPDTGQIRLFHKIRQRYPGIAVVLLTPLNREGAGVAINGLLNGAVDYITKPEPKNCVMLAGRHFQKRVIPVVKAYHALNLVKLTENNEQISVPGPFEGSKTSSSPARFTNHKIGLISVNGCLGAIPSLFSIVAQLPPNLQIPVMIVQHMPKHYTNVLARQLDRVTPLHVREAKNASPLIAGQVYLAPGGYHTVVRNDGHRKVIGLHRGPREHRCRPSIDVFIRSAVQAYNGKLLGVFLSGGGIDGVNGAGEIINSGGSIILENSKSALLWDTASKIAKLKEGLDQHPAGLISGEIRKYLIADKERQPIRSLFEINTGEGLYT